MHPSVQIHVSQSQAAGHRDQSLLRRCGIQGNTQSESDVGSGPHAAAGNARHARDIGMMVQNQLSQLRGVRCEVVPGNQCIAASAVAPPRILQREQGLAQPLVHFDVLGLRSDRSRKWANRTPRKPKVAEAGLEAPSRNHRKTQFSGESDYKSDDTNAKSDDELKLLRLYRAADEATRLRIWEVFASHGAAENV